MSTYRVKILDAFGAELDLMSNPPAPLGPTRAEVQAWLTKDAPTEECASAGAPDIVIGWINNLIFYPDGSGQPAAPLTKQHATDAGRNIRVDVFELDPAPTGAGGPFTNKEMLNSKFQNAVNDPISPTVPTAAATAIQNALDFPTNSLLHTQVENDFHSMIAWFNRTLFAHKVYPTSAAAFVTQGAEIYNLLVAEEPAMT